MTTNWLHGPEHAPIAPTPGLVSPGCECGDDCADGFSAHYEAVRAGVGS